MKTRSFGVCGIVIVGSLLGGSRVLAAGECPQRARCDSHKENADYDGEDRYSDGVHYRIYVHSVAERAADGSFEKHKIAVKCENKARSCADRARCDFHKEDGDWSGEDEYIGGTHYRIYVHSMAEADENGKFKKHSFKVRCE